MYALVLLAAMSLAVVAPGSYSRGHTSLPIGMRQMAVGVCMLLGSFSSSLELIAVAIAFFAVAESASRSGAAMG